MLFVYCRKKIMTKIEKKNSYLPNYPILFEHVNSSAVLRRIFIPLTQYGRPKNEPIFLKISPILFNFNQFNNCPFSLRNYFIILFSCLVSKISQAVCLAVCYPIYTFVKVPLPVLIPVCLKKLWVRHF